MRAMPDRSRPALGLAAPLLALAAPLCVLVLSACGSSGSTTTTATGAATTAAGGAAGPTKAEFVARAESICRTLGDAEKPLEAKQASLRGESTSTSQSAFVALGRQVVSLSRAAEAKLRALPRPAADAAAIGTLLDAFAHDVADAEELVQAAAKEESTLGLAAEETLRKSISKNSALAAEYGATLCTGAA
jgi:hypothetical protein